MGIHRGIVVLGLAIGAFSCSGHETSVAQTQAGATVIDCPTNRVVARQPLGMPCEPVGEFRAQSLTSDESHQYCVYQLGAEQAGSANRLVDAPSLDRLSLELSRRVPLSARTTSSSPVGAKVAPRTSLQPPLRVAPGGVPTVPITISTGAVVVRPPVVTPSAASSVELDLDCPITFAQQDSDLEQAAADFHGAFREHTGTVNLSAFAPSTAALGEGDVQIEVFDTAAIPYAATCSGGSCGSCRNPAPGDTNPHGRILGRIMGEMTCLGGPNCTPTIRILNRLAMPVVRVDESGISVDYACGGHIGRLSDLALALKASLSEYREGILAVLNLSLGWAGREETMGARAVHALLTRASCNGMLAVAAAGNAHGDDRSGPLYPAAWENEPAPSVERCRVLGFENSISDSVALAERRLVYAASALDYGDAPLASVRDGGRSRIEALGMGGIAREPRLADGMTPILSGSSVAAAVTSGVAALVWLTQPGLSQHTVAREIYRAGSALRHRAEFGVGAGSIRARSVSLCRALPSWASVGCSESSTYPDLELPASASVVPVFIAGSCDVPDSTCSDPGPAELPDPWLGPQPPFPGCPHCAFYRSAGQLYVDYPGTQVSYLRLNRASSTLRYNLSNPSVGFSTNLLAASATFSDVAALYENEDWLVDEAEPVSATLELYDEVTGTVREEPVLLLE